MRKVKPILKSFPPAHRWKSVLEVKVSITLPEGARCCSIFLKALVALWSEAFLLTITPIVLGSCYRVATHLSLPIRLPRKTTDNTTSVPGQLSSALLTVSSKDISKNITRHALNKIKSPCPTDNLYLQGKYRPH